MYQHTIVTTLMKLKFGVNKIIINIKGYTMYIKECWHFRDFAKCEHFEEKEEKTE